MNSENFLHFLKNPAHLYEITYQELKSLVLQYPYCQNLRYLLVTKSKIDSQPEYNNDLKVAATYSIDRSKLHYQLLHSQYHQTSTDGSLVINDDYLELTELTKLEEQLNEQSVFTLADNDLLELNIEEKNLLEADLSNQLGNSPGSTPIDSVNPSSYLIDEILEDDDTESEMATDEISPLLEQKEPPANIINYKDLHQENVLNEEDEILEEEEDYEVADYNSDNDLNILLSEEEENDFDEEVSHHQSDQEKITISPILKDVFDINVEEEVYFEEEEDLDAEPYLNKEIALEDNVLQPTPKQSFSSWLQQFQPPSESINYEKSIEEEVKEEKTIVKKKKHKTHKIARKSVMENEDIASETLAHLLATQGYYKKAIKMYEKLSERYPEKSNFFAAKIVTLLDLKDKS